MTQDSLPQKTPQPIVPCPNCSLSIAQKQNIEGTEINCPKCGHLFYMPIDQSRLNWLDSQLIQASGASIVLLCLIANGLALLLGIVALITSRHPIARKRATELTTVGAVIAVVGFLLLFFLISMRA